MAFDLATLVCPEHTALVTQECQRGVMGDLSALPELAEAAGGEVTKNIASANSFGPLPTAGERARISVRQSLT